MLVPAQAGVAQLVEQRICNPQVTGSSPLASSSRGVEQSKRGSTSAGVAERSMAADCKSAGQCPTVVQIHPPAPFACNRGSNSGVESQPSKLLVAGSNPVSRSRASWAQVAQAVEHVLGKDGVTSSNLVLGSSIGFVPTARAASGNAGGVAPRRMEREARRLPVKGGGSGPVDLAGAD